MPASQTAALVAELRLGAADVAAHEFLRTAQPAVGSTVSQSPNQALIEFTEGMEPRFSTIIGQSTQGAQVQTGAPRTLSDGAYLAVDLQSLPAGSYTAIQHGTATYTHRTGRRFTFKVSAR
jgi:methionine-rich copper-binding protein CopC